MSASADGRRPTPSDISTLASALLEAERSARPGPPPSEAFPGLALEDAYAIQRAYLGLREKSGVAVLGHKIGCTNPIVQRQFNVDQPDYGRLLTDMVLEDGAVIDASKLVAPRVEPEIAFLLGTDVAGPGVTAAAVLYATAGVAPSLEIIDSRISDWRITFVDTVSDNGSSARAVIGSRFRRPDSVDLRTMGVVLERDGEVLATGAGAAVMGHPAVSVAWLANALAEHGERLRAGQIVLSGALTAALEARAGDVWYASFGQLGTVRCRFAPAGGSGS